ncbi:MAG: hypothetical protein GX631_05270 [Dehalococcoidales bacterium]|jgi:hypothetical protein|nr:hypothetical protein [Dehalococcoidales bacterium]
MYAFTLEGKAYIPVLYNLALIMVFSTAIGLLMSKVTELFNKSNEDSVISHPQKKKTAQK